MIFDSSPSGLPTRTASASPTTDSPSARRCPWADRGRVVWPRLPTWTSTGSRRAPRITWSFGSTHRPTGSWTSGCTTMRRSESPVSSDPGRLGTWTSSCGRETIGSSCARTTLARPRTRSASSAPIPSASPRTRNPTTRQAGLRRSRGTVASSGRAFPKGIRTGISSPRSEEPAPITVSIDEGVRSVDLMEDATTSLPLEADESGTTLVSQPLDVGVDHYLLVRSDGPVRVPSRRSDGGRRTGDGRSPAAGGPRHRVDRRRLLADRAARDRQSGHHRRARRRSAVAPPQRQQRLAMARDPRRHRSSPRAGRTVRGRLRDPRAEGRARRRAGPGDLRGPVR